MAQPGSKASRTGRKITRQEEYDIIYSAWQFNGEPRQFDYIWEDGSGGIYEQGWDEEGNVIFWEVAWQEGTPVNNETAEPPVHNIGWAFVNWEHDYLKIDRENLTVEYVPMPMRS